MQGNMFFRNDTIFGVCQALGEDFGFNPNILRVALILPLFWLPMQMLTLYLGLGLVVLVSRFAFPVRKAAAIDTEINALPAKAEAQVVQDTELAKAA